MKFIDEKLENYCIEKSNIPSENCAAIEHYTKENVVHSQMLIGKMEGSFLGFLIRSHGVRRILEIGTYTGYSALAMAENLPENGSLITLDVNKKTSKIAHDFWAKSPAGDKITQVLGPAIESLKEIAPGIDLVFIDADKNNYFNYLQACLPLLSDKGIIVIDNVLWSGKVVSPAQEDSTASIQKVNDYISSRKDLYGTLLPIRDGMFLIQKKKF